MKLGSSLPARDIKSESKREPQQVLREIFEMRILILTQYFPPETGAPQTRLAAFTRELVRLEHEVEVVTTLPNYPAGRVFPGYRGRFYIREDWGGVPVHRAWVHASMGKGLGRLLNYVSFAASSLFALSRAKRPDYIFVESPPLFLAIPAILAARSWGAATILNVADLWPDAVRQLGVLKPGLILRAAEWLEQWAYRKADFVNAVTEGIARTLIEEKAVPPHKLLHLSNGVDTELFRPSAPDEDLIEQLGLTNKKIFLYQGTLGYAHALENTLRAAALLRDETHIHFVFLGDGSEKSKLIRMATELSLENTSFLDFVPVEQVAAYLSIACCGLASLRDIPLFRGARPSKLLPIIASAKPVIFCGPEGETSCFLRESGAGIVAPPDDPAALANAIRRIARNPGLAKELGENGRRYAEHSLTWSKLVSDWIADLNASQSQNRMVA